MLVDRALFGKDSKLGKRLRENKKLNIAVEGAFSGPLLMTNLKVIFARYFVLAEKLKDRVAFIHADLKSFLDKDRAASRKDLGDLGVFHSKSDDVLTFRELMSTLVYVKRRLEKDNDALAASFQGGVDELRVELRSAADFVKASGFDLEAFATTKTRAMLILMNTKLYKALEEILAGMDALFEDVTTDHSIMSILAELGVDLGDLSKVHEEIREAVEPRMEAFKAKKEKLEAEAAGKKPIPTTPL